MEDKKDKQPEEFADLFDPTYRGNIFGWKLSFIGLGIILLAVGTVIYRHIALGVPFTGPAVAPEVSDTVQQIVRDTI